MSHLIEFCLKPKIGLYIFETYHHQMVWLWQNKKEIIDSGAVLDKINSKITFPNGTILYLGHAESEEDYDKYLSLEYSFLLGGNERLRQRIKNP